MDRNEFNTLYAPLSVKFGCHISALLPADLATRLSDTSPQNLDNHLAIASEYAIQKRFFIQLLNHDQLIAEFDCTQHQYDHRLVPNDLIHAAIHHQHPAA